MSDHKEFVHIGSDCGYNHTVMYGEILRDWVSGRLTLKTSKASFMYSPAIVTSHNSVRELCYVPKKSSQKGDFPKYIG